MVCDLCKSTSEYREKLEYFGYYGDDTYMVYLMKCPNCDVYYRKGIVDNFETGGGVSESVSPIDKNEAIEIMKRIIEKFKDKKDEESISIFDRIKKEMEKLSK